MLNWIAAIVILAIVLIWLGRRVLTGLAEHSSRINDYYAKALAAWVLRNDSSARLAALTAAKVAAPLQRVSMLGFLDVCRSIVVRAGAVDDDVRRLFDSFATELQAKDWTSIDIVSAKRQLAAQDAEYAKALDVADSKVFERRYPDLS